MLCFRRLDRLATNVTHVADLLVSQAEKALQGASGGFSLFGGRTEKYENAADLYVQAANAFRVQKMSMSLFSLPTTPRHSRRHAQNICANINGETDKEAGLAFEKAAAIQTNSLNEPDDAANSLTEAFKVYRKTDPQDAVRVLSSAIHHYISKGNFRRAANQQQNLGEVFEIEIGDPKKALDAYEKAADWYENDNSQAYVAIYLC